MKPSHKKPPAQTSAKPRSESSRAAVSSYAPDWSDTRTVFSAMLHQLSQPLTVLRGQLELSLRKGRTPQEYRLGIERAIDEAERLMELFRSARRVAEAAEERAVQPLCLSAVVSATCEDLAAVAASTNVRLDTDVEADVAVLGNPLSLRETVFNLVAFALHGSGPGGTVSLSLRRQAHDAVLRIRGARAHGAHPSELRPRAVTSEDSAPAGLPDDWVLAVARCTLASMGAALETEDNGESTDLRIVFRAAS